MDRAEKAAAVMADAIAKVKRAPRDRYDRATGDFATSSLGREAMRRWAAEWVAQKLPRQK